MAGGCFAFFCAAYKVLALHSESRAVLVMVLDEPAVLVIASRKWIIVA